MRTKIVALALAACLCASASAADKKAVAKPWTQEPDSFIGIKFNSAITSDLPQCPAGIPGFQQKNLCYVKPYTPNYYTIEGKPSIGLTYNYTLSAKVTDQQVEYFYLSANADDYLKLAQVFITKYGQPTKQVTDKVKTKAGAEFTNETLTWVGKINSITVQKYAGDIKTSAAILSNNALTAKASAETSSKIGDGASKL